MGVAGSWGRGREEINPGTFLNLTWDPWSVWMWESSAIRGHQEWSIHSSHMKGAQKPTQPDCQVSNGHWCVESIWISADVVEVFDQSCHLDPITDPTPEMLQTLVINGREERRLRIKCSWFCLRFGIIKLLAECRQVFLCTEQPVCERERNYFQLRVTY